MTEAPTESGTLTPVLLTSSEREALARLLEHVERFDSGGLRPEARHLAAHLGDTDRVGDEITWGYSLEGPWGSHAADDEPSAIAECRAARAAHWAEGWGRDERYAEIQVSRYPTVYFADGGFWRGASERVEILDAPLTPVEEAENRRRIESAKRKQEALWAHLRGAAETTERAVPEGVIAPG